MRISFYQDAAFLDAAVREREEELSRRTLQALLDMRIKFPGKTDEEAEVILESVSVGHFAGCFSNVSFFISSFGKSLDEFILEQDLLMRNSGSLLFFLFPSDSR